MYKLKKRFIALMFGILCLICAGVAYYLEYNKPVDPNKQLVNIYFFNPVTNVLEPEVHYIDIGDKKSMADAVYNLIKAGPKSKNLVKTYSENIEFLDGRIFPNDQIFEIEFAESYNKLPPIEEQFLRGSIVYSMTELDFIKDILIYAGDKELLNAAGKPVGYLNRTNFLINPQISPDKFVIKTVVLYFVDEKAKKLVQEQRKIKVNPDQPIEKYILEQLILGPTDDYYSPTVPKETKIKGEVKTEEGVCYFNLSNEYSSKMTSTGEILQLNIFSIVNSLTELEGISKVQFLIEAEKVENFKSSFDLSKPIERNESLILK